MAIEKHDDATGYPQSDIKKEQGLPEYQGGNSNSDEDIKVETDTESYYKLGFWTRMGCTPESFKRRNAIDKSNQLNKTLKSRHMHMIAIGMVTSSLISSTS